LKKSWKSQSGSLTVEAAFVLPICVFTMLIFLCLFIVMSLQANLQFALTQVASEFSEYAYIVDSCTEKNSEQIENQKELEQEEKLEKEKELFDVGALCNGIVSHAFLSKRLESYLNVEERYHNILKGNVSFLESRLLNDGETIDIIAKYVVHIPVPLISMIKFYVIQRVRTRAYIGVLSIDGENDEDGDSGKRYVYVTETGKVYHCSRNCTHILLSIRSCNKSMLQTVRNRSGGIYKPCEKCCKSCADEETVYITNEGVRYHSSLECSGLKRSVRRIPLEEVSGRSACKKCGCMEES